MSEFDKYVRMVEDGMDGDEAARREAFASDLEDEIDAALKEGVQPEDDAFSETLDDLIARHGLVGPEHAEFTQAEFNRACERISDERRYRTSRVDK